MKHHAPRKRATAKNRAAKRHPKPHIPAPMAPRFTPSPVLDWDSEEIPEMRLTLFNDGWLWFGVAVGVGTFIALAWLLT